jgi:hypothetical protein
MPGAPDPIYVRARRALLDALQALGAHQRAVILVGAQAIYLHAGESDLGVAPYTTDGDLALDPSELAGEPKLDDALQAVGFVRSVGLVGTWISPGGVPIDLFVPEAVGGKGRRAARLGPHGDRVARKGRGLEAVLVDNGMMEIASLDESDPRTIAARVAGPAGLLIARLHKIADRHGSFGRQDDQDALDIYRLLRAVPTDDLANRTRRLLDTEIASRVTGDALGILETMFGSPRSPGSMMAARAVELVDDPALVAASVSALAADLLAAFKA